MVPEAEDLAIARKICRNALIGMNTFKRTRHLGHFIRLVAMPYPTQPTTIQIAEYRLNTLFLTYATGKSFQAQSEAEGETS